MPREIINVNTDGKVSAPASSRYFNKSVILYEGRLTYATYKKKKLSFAPQDQHYEITKDAEFRPDLVSYTFFGAPDFWWRIMEMNGMKDILEFRAGRNIILPGSGLLL